MATFKRETVISFQRGSATPDREAPLDQQCFGMLPRDRSDRGATATILSFDTAHAPAVRAFLADVQDGMAARQTALAQAVMLARQVC